ncbi:MAG TPA: hypothetical protein DEG43_11025 [Acidimicrobiaceae bacterium]|nr:hypothetical protein [Acidimicrobiaceae bacterium]
MTEPVSALPSVAARVLAFSAIMIFGAIGAGTARFFMSLQCEGACTVPNGIAMLIGTAVAAGGAAVIATLSLRAVGEWTASNSSTSGNGEGS